MTRDRIAEFFREKTAKRGLALVLFLALVLVFRKLLVLLAFFVMFERALFLSAGWLSRRFKLGRLMSVVLVLFLSASTLAVIGWLSAGRVAKIVVETREQLPQRVAALKETPLYLDLHEHLPDSEKLVQSAERYAADVAHSAAAVGHFLLMALIGLVLAVVYFLDQEKILSFRGTLPADTLFGTLARWVEHTAEAVSLTIQVQLIVAALNTVLTLPVLLLIGVPHVGMLMLLIFVASLVPVVGNLISGAVLCVLAHQANGWFGVGLFLGLTFVLHKVESYYLNPRLTARHVQLPGFVLIISLIAWEHLLGFVGLFVSFPVLFVAGKLLSEFRAEDAPVLPSSEPAPLPPA